MKPAATLPGRTCPPGYGYSPSVFARAPDVTADVLYVVGGLYGNLPALHEIERMVALETAPTRVVYNGDFHWFDAGAADLGQRRELLLGAGGGQAFEQVAGHGHRPPP